MYVDLGKMLVHILEQYVFLFLSCLLIRISCRSIFMFQDLVIWEVKMNVTYVMSSMCLVFFPPWGSTAQKEELSLPSVHTSLLKRHLWSRKCLFYINILLLLSMLFWIIFEIIFLIWNGKYLFLRVKLQFYFCLYFLMGVENSYVFRSNVWLQSSAIRH